MALCFITVQEICTVTLCAQITSKTHISKKFKHHHLNINSMFLLSCDEVFFELTDIIKVSKHFITQTCGSRSSELCKCGFIGTHLRVFFTL